MELFGLLMVAVIVDFSNGENVKITVERNSTSGSKICPVDPPNRKIKSRSSIECGLACHMTSSCSRFTFQADSGSCEMFFCRYGLPYSTCEQSSTHFQIYDPQIRAIPSVDDLVCGIQLASWAYSDTCQQEYIMTSGGSNYATIPDIVRGLNTGELDPCTCTLKNTQRFDTWASTSDTNAFVSYLSTVSVGTVVIGVCADSCMNNLSPAFSVLDSYGISVSTLASNAKFYFVLKKGFPQSTFFRWSDTYRGALVAVVKIGGLTNVTMSLISSENC